MRVALAVLVLLVIAAPAQAGQIVFVHADAQEAQQIWTMREDGTKPKQLVGNVPLGMNDLREPAVAADGTTIAFSGTTLKNAHLADGQQHYGVNATGLYLWRSGKVKRVTGEPAPCFGCSTFETKPSVGPDGGTLTTETFFSTARPGNFGRLLRRPAGGGAAAAFPAVCQDTDLDDAAISPRDAGLVAYVGCDAQIVLSPDRVPHAVAARGQFAPAARSPAWAPDGSRLASIDLPGDETTEIWTYRPDGSDARLVLIAPADVSIRTVAFLGAGTLVLDADGDIWTVPLTCASCAFPAGARQLTRDGRSTEPAWTPAAVLGGPRVKAAKAKRGFALKLTLPLAARVRVKAGGKTVTRRLKAGRRTVKVRGLRPGRYTVRVSVPGFGTEKVKVRVRRR